MKPGLADVVYVKSEDAVTATKTYHNRELDGELRNVIYRIYSAIRQGLPLSC